MSTNHYLSTIQEDLIAFSKGNLLDAYKLFGNHASREDGQDGFRFTLWAPKAKRVFLVGDFNDWQKEEMTYHQKSGIWTIFSSQAKEFDKYKYFVEQADGKEVMKIDPYAIRFETPPQDASIVYQLKDKSWSDQVWSRRQRKRQIEASPLNIYEVHANSWRKHEDGSYYSFSDLTKTLIPYVKEMGYTHIEFLPLTDHPLEASWGYQTTGYYAISGRIGTIDDFRDFVEAAHLEGIGIIMDWVPGHFCRNANALAYFDGTATYEYESYTKADNPGWGTLNFDLGKPQVQSFLLSNILYFLKECHVDGIRVDAVSAMLYLDFCKDNWEPNIFGNNVNLEAVTFLRRLNDTVRSECPHAFMMAEESTTWEGITKPTQEGGLGFHFKWNMGWMNDTLKYIEIDPFFRNHHYSKLNFSFMYAFSEHYILPFSHDEVVHGKHSILGRTPGNRYQQFANLRVLQAYMMAHPGKKLNFMGYEIGQFLEWRFDESVEWSVLQNEFNSEYQTFIKDLNHFYVQENALYTQENHYGFTPLNLDGNQESIISFIRRGKKARDFLVCIANFVPVQYDTYRVGVPYKGTYEVAFNTEMKTYGGMWLENQGAFKTEDIPWQNQPYSFEVVVPSLASLFIKPKRIYNVKN